MDYCDIITLQVCENTDSWVMSQADQSFLKASPIILYFKRASLGFLMPGAVCRQSCRRDKLATEGFSTGLPIAGARDLSCVLIGTRYAGTCLALDFR